MPRTFPLALAAALGLVSVRAQTPAQSTFRAGVDLVQVDVSVLDQQRRPVRGLTASDFTLLEDGKPRPIVAFTAVDLPERADIVAAPWTRDIAPDVATNTLPDEGRLVMILMDRTIPDGWPTINARNIAKAVVNELGTGDLAAVVYSGTGTPHDFTGDRARLIKTIDGSYPASELSEAANAAWEGMLGDALSGRSTPAGASELGHGTDCRCGVCVLESITRVADAMRDVERRRKLVFFLGADITVETTDFACIDRLHDARGAMFKAMDLANLTVYSFDVTGLQTLNSAGDARVMGYQGRANLVRQSNLAVLPDRTGGSVVKNTNTAPLRVSEIFHESDSYYLLGFQPASPDGQRHNISVKANRRGLDVHARRAFVAAGGAASAGTPASTPRPTVTLGDEARYAIDPTMAVHDGITMSAAIMPFQSPSAHEPVLAVALHIEHEPNVGVGVSRPNARLADASPYVSPAGGPELVYVVTSVFTMTGQPIGTLRQTLTVTPTSSAGAGGAAYDLLQRIPAKPGRYELRIGVHNRSRQQTGSVHAFVDVPAFNKTPIAMSDIAIYAASGSMAMKDSLADVLLAPATARRVFDRREHASAFLRLTQHGGDPTSISLSARVMDAQDHKRFGQDGSFPSQEFGTAGLVDYVLDLPLADLEPGPYLLTIEARARGWSARRDVRFMVR